MTPHFACARPLLAACALAACSLFTATAAAAAPASPSAGASAVSVRDCTSTGGAVWLDAPARPWCVGGVYTGTAVD